MITLSLNDPSDKQPILAATIALFGILLVAVLPLAVVIYATFHHKQPYAWLRPVGMAMEAINPYFYLFGARAHKQGNLRIGLFWQGLADWTEVTNHHRVSIAMGHWCNDCMDTVAYGHDDKRSLQHPSVHWHF